MELTKKLIIEIVNFINTNVNTCQEKNILNILKKFSLTKNNYTYPNYNSPPKIKSLQKALSNIQLKKLFPVKKAILSALPELNWKIDNGSFYDKHSEV